MSNTTKPNFQDITKKGFGNKMLCQQINKLYNNLCFFKSQNLSYKKKLNIKYNISFIECFNIIFFILQVIMFIPELGKYAFSSEIIFFRLKQNHKNIIFTTNINACLIYKTKTTKSIKKMILNKVKFLHCL